MKKLIDFVKKNLIFSRPNAYKLTRSVARDLVLKGISPSLTREGFVHCKGSSVWRIGENKTDVIELRFLTLKERQQFKIPESTFSINYGCYYHFVPDIYEGKFIHQIHKLITPREVDCHYRDQATRSIKQKPRKMDLSAWHLDEPRERQQSVLDDVVAQLEAEIFPALDRLSSINEWIRFLENEEDNLGTGKKDSLLRHFLLSFAYGSIDNIDKARTHLLIAKQLSEETINRLSRLDVPTSDMRKRLELIDSSLNEM